MIKVPTSLNDLKTKLNDLDVSKSKDFPVDLKKLSYVVDNEVVKTTKFNAIKTKVNKLDKKIPDTTTLIYKNQYQTNNTKLN